MFKSFLSYPKSCSLCCADLGIVQFLLEKLALFKNCNAIFVLSEISCEISLFLIIAELLLAGRADKVLLSLLILDVSANYLLEKSLLNVAFAHFAFHKGK